jgi:hypothetical protein
MHVDRKTALEGRGLRATPKNALKQAGFRLRSCALAIGGDTGLRDRTRIGAEHVKRSRVAKDEGSLNKGLIDCNIFSK